MRDTLRPSLPLEADESPTSFASRLALLHGRTAVQFCQDLRIGFQALADGREDALARLSELTDTPLDRLRHNAIIRTDRVSYEWREQDLGRDNLSRYTLQVCPRCLAEDVGRAARGQGGGPYGRATWLLRYVRTCQGHRVALAPVTCTWRTVNDFARAVRPILDDLRRLADGAEDRIPSRLEAYLLDRLAGRPRADAAWLDGLGFAAAADTCETLGAVLAFGRSVLMRSLGAAAWHAAGDMGFEVVHRGPVGLEEALRAWDAGAADDPTSRRPQISTYGAFHTLLSRTRRRRPDLDPVRAAVTAHVLRTRPMAPGTKVLGGSVGEPLVHSIKTAAKAYGLDARLVRGFLRATGAIGPEADAVASHAVLFDARAHGPSIEELARSIPSAGVAAHLGVSRSQASALMRSGLLSVMPIRGAIGVTAKRYRPDALDGFVSRLLVGAEDVPTPRAGTCEVWEAAARTRRDPVAIVRLILDGELPWVGRRSGASGLGSVMVRVQDVTTLLEGGDPREWSLNALADELKLDHDVLVGLIETGMLRGRRAGSSDGRVSRRVSDQSLREFLDDYVWLAQLGREWGLDPRTCRKALEEADVRPLTSRQHRGTRFYRRRDLPPRP